MKNCKRIFSFLLAVIIVIGLIPIDVYAAVTNVYVSSSTLSGLTCKSFISNTEHQKYIDMMMKHYISENSKLQTALDNGLSVVFMFEGGSDNFPGTAYSASSSNVRNQAVIIVVQKNSGKYEIVFREENSSSLPSQPEDTSGSSGYIHETLIDGIYSIQTVNHHGEYGALKVMNPFCWITPPSNKDGYGSDYDGGIHIHTRSTNNAGSGSGAWSAGCQLVGVGSGTSNTFNELMKAVADINYNVWKSYYASTNAERFSTVTAKRDVGYYVIDRQLALSGLTSMYNNKALASITAYSKTEKEKAEGFKITFHPNGANQKKTEVNIEEGNALGTLPTPSWSGMNFEGWYTAPFGGTQVTASTVPTGDMEIYAHWTYAYGSEVKLEFDANGGTLPGPVLSRKCDGINIRERPGESLVVYKDKDIYWSNIYGKEIAVAADGKAIGYRAYEEAFNRDFLPDGGFVLSGQYHWDSSVGADVGGSAFVAQVKTLMDKGDVYVSIDYETGMVKVFDSYAGYLAETKMGQEYTTYGALPVPTRSGYVFDGWQVSGREINYYSSFAGKYLTASWTSESQLSPEATTEYDGRRYELYDDIVSWSKAKALCESMGGHLVTIIDSGEQAAVKALIAQGTRGSYKIGATDQDAEGNWKWVTGEEFSYENWDPDYPEPSGGSGENYAGIIAIENPPYKNVGEWIDSPDAYYGNFYDLSNTGFICEYEGTPKYELTYHYGINETKSDSYEVEAGDVMVTSVPYAFGYNCLGWSLSPTDLTVDYLPYENITITGDTALYAVWETAPVIPSVKNAPQVLTGRFVDPTVRGYWHQFTADETGVYLFEIAPTKGDLQLAIYDVNDNLRGQSDVGEYSIKFSIDAGETVYLWTTCHGTSTPSSFTMCGAKVACIYYDANGGSDAPENHEGFVGAKRNVSDVVPARNGYTFLGWAADQNATTAQYHAGDEITMAGDMTLYAVWKCEHNYNYRLTKKPDLTTAGSMVGTCSVCSATTEAITLPKLNTTDYTYQETKAATCTEAGSGKYTWKTTTYGSFSFDVVLEKLGHTYTAVVTAPNCTEKGYTTHTCTCGDSYVDTYVDATGHKWDSGKVTTAATCTKDGVKTYTCTACKETKTEVIPATGHSYTAVVTAPNCTEKGYTTHACSCGDSYVDTYVDATGHSYEANRTEPTCSEPGHITYICACGDSYIGESIPSPGHNYQNGTCTRCGEADPDYSETISGTCGDNLIWTLDGEGVLTISGTGDMTEYNSANRPWQAYKDIIRDVVVNDGVTSISQYAFFACMALETVDVADSVTTIGQHAFGQCKNLVKADTGNGITVLAYNVFYKCVALNDVSLSNKLTQIDTQAFAGCTSLSNIKLPNSLTKINALAFADCANLIGVEIPAAVNSFSYGIFAGCNNLKEINVAEGNKTYCSIDGAVYSASKATLYAVPAGWTGKFTVPENVKWIAEQAFRDCIYITEVELPETLIWIQSRGFMNCTGLTQITIPQNVTTLKTGAFYSCTNLKEITFIGKAPTFETNVFKDVTATVYYPANNETWTVDVMQDYGGKITWVAVESDDGDEEITITINTLAGAVNAPEGGWKEGTNTFTVAAEKACVVAVSYDGGSTYVRLAASATGTANTYSFTADDITADSVIAVAMTGDTNKDGKLTNADITRMKAAYQSKVQLDGLTQLAADVNNSGGITNADVTKLKAVYQNKTNFAW